MVKEQSYNIEAHTKVDIVVVVVVEVVVHRMVLHMAWTLAFAFAWAWAWALVVGMVEFDKASALASALALAFVAYNIVVHMMACKRALEEGVVVVVAHSIVVYMQDSTLVDILVGMQVEHGLALSLEEVEVAYNTEVHTTADTDLVVA